MTCSTCKTACAVPQACHEPEPGPPPRLTTWRRPRVPVTIAGPYRPRRRRSPTTRAVYLTGIAYLLLMVVVLALYFARSTPTH
jgi:hypothetical protein